MYIRIHTYVYTYIYTYIYTHLYTYMYIYTGSFREIETTVLTQSACFWTHTDEASTQPASVVCINHKETATPASEFLHLLKKIIKIFHRENLRFL